MSEKRQIVIKQLTNAIDKHKLDLPCNSIINIEKSIYNSAITQSNGKCVASWENPEFVNLYKRRAINIVSLIRRNPENLITRIREKQIKSSDIAFVPNRTIEPEKHKILDEKSKKVYVVNEDDISDGIFECARCEKYKTTYHQIQIKDTSESMTTFVSCLLCGIRWRL